MTDIFKFAAGGVAGALTALGVVFLASSNGQADSEAREPTDLSATARPTNDDRDLDALRRQMRSLERTVARRRGVTDPAEATILGEAGRSGESEARRPGNVPDDDDVRRQEAAQDDFLDELARQGSDERRENEVSGWFADAKLPPNALIERLECTTSACTADLAFADRRSALSSMDAIAMSIRGGCGVHIYANHEAERADGTQGVFVEVMNCPE